MSAAPEHLEIPIIIMHDGQEREVARIRYVRDDVAEHENAELRRKMEELRERCRYLKKGDILHVLTDQEYIDQCERERLMQVSMDALVKENAKLRELIQLIIRRHTPISPCKSISCGECPAKDECDQEDALMRELGIEVDE